MRALKALALTVLALAVGAGLCWLGIRYDWFKVALLCSPFVLCIVVNIYRGLKP